MPRYRCDLSYHGGSFAGFQKQDHTRTVQGEIESALSVVARTPVEIWGAGRTDAGVHAHHQVIHFDVPYELNAPVVLNGLNHFLMPHMAIHSMCIVPDDFHARFSAKKRIYEYTIWNDSTPSPFTCDRAWTIHHRLHIQAMQEAAHILVGSHDFSSFRSHRCQSRSPLKTLDVLRCVLTPPSYVWHIESKSFLHHQVRFMVGALVEVGKGRRSVEWIQDLLNNPNPQKPVKAPAQGLSLIQIEY